jgi:DNA-binding response OmpR family regulator
VRFAVAQPVPRAHAARGGAVPQGRWVLIVEDEDATRLIYEKFLKGSPFTRCRCRTSRTRASSCASTARGVILDILLPGEEHQTWRWLADVKASTTDPDHRREQLRRRAQGAVLGADAYLAKPVTREVLLEKLEAFARADGARGCRAHHRRRRRGALRDPRSVREAMRFEEAATAPPASSRPRACVPR